MPSRLVDIILFHISGLVFQDLPSIKIPALLNTSLNLHGNPIASKLEDIIATFKNSDLKFLYIEDNYLIEKK